MDDHCDTATYVQAAQLLMRVAATNDLDLLNETFRYCVDANAISACMCELCRLLRASYVTSWQRIVSEYERDGVSWGLRRTSPR